MLVSKYYVLGNLTVPSSWIALMIAFVIAYVVVRMKYNKQVAETFSDLIFTFIIVWKLSVVLTHFDTIIQSPLSIFYFHGGRVGVFLALLTVGGKVSFDLYKHRMNVADLRALFIGFVAVQALYSVLMIGLNPGTTMMTYVGVVILLLVSLYMIMVLHKEQVLLVYWVLLFAALHLFTSAFQEAGITGTSVLSTLVLSMFFVGIHLRSNIKGRELVE